MSEGYFCELCGYTTGRKSNLERHLARKTNCNVVIQMTHRIVLNVTGLSQTRIANILSSYPNISEEKPNISLCNTNSHKRILKLIKERVSCVKKNLSLSNHV